MKSYLLETPLRPQATIAQRLAHALQQLFVALRRLLQVMMAGVIDPTAQEQEYDPPADAPVHAGNAGLLEEAGVSVSSRRLDAT